jgi:hypothetical protein
MTPCDRCKVTVHATRRNAARSSAAAAAAVASVAGCRRTMPSRSNPRGQTARPAGESGARPIETLLPTACACACDPRGAAPPSGAGAARRCSAPRGRAAAGPRHLILGTAPQGARRAHRPALGLRGGGGTRGACAPRLRGGVCADAAAGAVQPSTRIAGRWIAPPQLPPCARRCGPRVARASTRHSRRAHPLLFRWRTAARKSFLPLFPPPYPRRWPLRRPRPWAARFRRRWALRQAACLARRCRAPRRALRRARRLRRRLPPSTRRFPLRCRLRCRRPRRRRCLLRRPRR